MSKNTENETTEATGKKADTGEDRTKKVLYESQKNYLTCAVLMLIVGVLMIPLGKDNWAMGCIFVGVLFLIGFFVLLKREGLCVVDLEDEEARKQAKKDARRRYKEAESDKTDDADKTETRQANKKDV